MSGVRSHTPVENGNPNPNRRILRVRRSTPQKKRGKGGLGRCQENLGARSQDRGTRMRSPGLGMKSGPVANPSMLQAAVLKCQERKEQRKMRAQSHEQLQFVKKHSSGGLVSIVPLTSRMKEVDQAISASEKSLIENKYWQTEIEQEQVEMKTTLQKLSATREEKKAQIKVLQRYLIDTEPTLRATMEAVHSVDEKLGVAKSQAVMYKKQLDSLQHEKVRLNRRWDQFMLKIKNGQFDQLNVSDMEIFLAETNLQRFADVLSQSGVVSDEVSQLHLVDQHFFQDMKLLDMFSLGDRQRLLFHLDYIRKNKRIYSYKGDQTFRTWSKEDVLAWLEAVDATCIYSQVEQMNICGVALATVTREALVDEVMRLSPEDTYAARRAIREFVKVQLWGKIVSLKKANQMMGDADEEMLEHSGLSARQQNENDEKLANGGDRAIGAGLVESGADGGRDVQAESDGGAKGDNREKEGDLDVPSQFLCPITQDIMTDPVLCKDGSTYERAAIESWIQKHGTSPISREPMRQHEVFPNRALKEMIDKFREQSLEDKAANQV